MVSHKKINSFALVSLYNKKNKVTSLLTYEGKVQIAKVEKRDPSQPSVIPKTNEEYLIQKQDEMNGLLKSKKSVGVNKGQYSGTSPKVQKTSLPVKISPVQFTALYKNDELKDESDIEKSVKSRTSFGGTSPSEVQKRCQDWRKKLDV